MLADMRRYHLLDGLRGIAALAVMWGHLLDDWEMQQFQSQQYALSVDFFFLLSGFVIAHAYGSGLRQGGSPGVFVWARIVRLFPLLILGALLGGGVLLFRPDSDMWRAGVSTGLAIISLPSFLYPVIAFPVNSPAWSLFFEFVANIAYAPVARFLTRRWLLVAWVGAAAMFALAAQHWRYVELGWAQETLLPGLTRVGFGFIGGLTLHAFRSTRVTSAWLGLLLACILGVLVFIPAPLGWHEHLAIVLFGFPALIYVASTVKLGSTAQRICTVAGNLSYPLYITHWPVLRLMHLSLTQIDPEGRLIAIWLPLEIVSCLTFAWLAMKIIDIPVRRWLTRNAGAINPSPVRDAG